MRGRLASVTLRAYLRLERRNQMTAAQLKRKIRNFPVAKLQQKITAG